MTYDCDPNRSQRQSGRVPGWPSPQRHGQAERLETSCNGRFVMDDLQFTGRQRHRALFLTVLAFNLFGDGLRDAFDPKSRR